jgi:hypothetical protein
VVQPTDARKCDEPAAARWLDGARDCRALCWYARSATAADFIAERPEGRHPGKLRSGHARSLKRIPSAKQARMALILFS